MTMAVLIPDIDIPNTCSDCPCYDAEYEMCNLTKTEIVWSRPALTSRAKDCPLIEIVRCCECKCDDRYVTANGNKYCHCIETETRGRTETDHCSYYERKNGDVNA